MNIRYNLLFVMVPLACISSCTITINPVFKSESTISKTPSVSPAVIEQITVPSENVQRNELFEDIRKHVETQVSIDTVKMMVCPEFIPPVVPEIPRVDLSKLRTISGNDHQSVENLLLDNIQALNEHSKKIERTMKQAVVNHRKLCVMREVIVK